MLTDSDFIPYDSPRVTWASLARPAWLLAAVGVLALVGSVANCWVVREVLRTSEARDAQWQRFHRDVLGELEALTRAVGLTTSYDLCPVRFRFRMDMFSEPQRPVGTARLSARDTSAFETRELHVAAVCDFGLIPPGRYRLDVEIGAYELVWDFDVFPAAPVDRVVLYPLQPPPHPGKLEIRGRTGETCVGGVCLVSALPVVVGDWTWHFREPVALVRDHRMSEQEFGRLMDHVPDLRRQVESGTVPLLEGVPFLDSEVTTAHVIAGGDGSPESYETIRFGEAEETAPSCADSCTLSGERYHPQRPQLHRDRNDFTSRVIVELLEGVLHGPDAAVRAAIMPEIFISPPGG